MGTKGRDLALYLYFGSFLIIAYLVITEKSKSYINLFVLILSLSCLYIVYYYAFYLPKAVKESRFEGFNSLILLPMYNWWVKTLLMAMGNNINITNQKAFELHLEVPNEVGLQDFLMLFEEDLKLLLAKKQGALILWETHVPIPQRVRSMLRMEIKNGNAFWQKKRWPIPRPPFTYTNLNKQKARSGAAIIPIIANEGEV